MHIHSQMNPVDAANFYGAAANSRADASRRAAETRRKLTSSAFRIGSGESLNCDSLSDDETFLVGHWLFHSPEDPLPGDEYRTGPESTGKDRA
jgi:hypothetical protein